MNFVNARLEQVLNYLSDAAGFVVVQQARVNGNVTIQGSHITKDQAVDLLNTELNQNNYAAIRDGNILTILNKSDARTGRIPVRMGNNPANIPNNDEIATWIVPIRFVEARELLSDLSVFVSAQAIIVANEAGNTIVITDTQAKIRHLVQIIQAVDNSAEAGTEIRVFPLKYASPADVASELTSAFPSASSSGDQAPIQFLGGPGDMFGNLFGGNGTDASSSEQHLQKATQITAVADARIQAVIVSAAKDIMKQIAGLVTDLDVSSTRDQKVYVFQVNDGDPQQVAQVLQSMFSNGNTSSSGTGSSQNSALMQRAQSTAASMGAITTSSSTTTTTGSGTGGNGGNGTGGGGGSGITF